ncbi:MAG TPA: PHB depolymerase family esterase [Galbitalea sp.]|jgi:polyhydroxybutyrate depolymerase|nr:PHB depolymerase family esterase [Galbitalea sp.]
MQLRRTLVAFLAAVTLALSLAGCGRGVAAPAASSVSPSPLSTTAAYPAGSSDQHIEVDGVARDYRIFIPAQLSPDAPLVIMLHGGFGDAQQAESSYGWDAQATADQFVVAYPNGVDRAWNAGGGCCGQPAAKGVNDVAFIAAVVAQIEARTSIDPSRVFATGISNGGMMAYRLACDTSLFAAIGPDSATLLGDCESPHPLSVIHIHGLADQNIPFAGGEGDGYAKIDGPPVQTTIAQWRTIDSCSPPTSTLAGVVTTSIALCPSGNAVELITIAGAGHQWPGSAERPVLEKVLGTDPPSQALNATETIWAFFAAHPGAIT